MGLTQILDIADQALDIAQKVPGLGAAAKVADIALGVARETAHLLAPGDVHAFANRLVEIEQRVAAHHERTMAVLKAAERG
ncbi:MAG: hypothetical protein INF91_10665 [Alphaproteobacteria bacterium]|nr:hypothetical protein [Alphaproteobacteria bacterium]